MWSPFQNELKLPLKWHRFRFKGFISAHEFTAYSQSSTTRNLLVVEIVDCADGDLLLLLFHIQLWNGYVFTIVVVFIFHDGWSQLGFTMS
jgi:hypothetical protein